ncbi:MAG: hypothetical protein DYH05_00390 [Acidobacteria bacterium ACB1]|nr:hypothetical protein [Acidobacteria bacterium ACB1]RIJ91984.1 MAG: hypothetical protein DCC44_08550 [Acidobacteriota bacterium]
MKNARETTRLGLAENAKTAKRSPRRTRSEGRKGREGKESHGNVLVNFANVFASFAFEPTFESAKRNGREVRLAENAKGETGIWTPVFRRG